jgi:N-acylneuraminate cytidylyltransferase
MIEANGSQHSVYAFVFARGGSKGVPGKNLRKLAGTSLIARAIACAQATQHADRVLVSTDSEAIADVARRAGAEIPFLRPAHLAADESPEWLAWRHALEFLAASGDAPDIFLSAPATAPLRQSGDLDACVRRLLDADTDVVISVTESDRSPYFNMVQIDDAGQASLAMQAGNTISRRQGAPVLYDITTVGYASRPSFILTHNGLFDGRTATVVVPRERALDIDTEYDLRIAAALIEGSAGDASSEGNP